MPRVKNLTLKLTYGLTRGTKVIPPRDGLQIYGPLLEIGIGPHRHLVTLLKSKGKPPPNPIVGPAIIDTGATVTTINTSVATQLNLRQSGRVESIGIGGTSSGFLAACSIDIKGLTVDIPRAHCHDLPGGLVALIGRDVLAHMVLIYDGIAGSIVLKVPAPEPPPPAKPSKKRRRRRK